MSNKYFAINIGPVAKTIGLARKPRELWLASYIFSYLAKHIISILKRENCTLLSPATFDKPYGIGLYPDRIFFNSEKDSSDILGYIETAWEQFNQGLGFDRSYFNIMLSECMASSHSEGIQTLNKKSDLLELSNFAQDDDSIQKVYDMITASTSNSSRILYKDAGFEGKMPVETLAEISAVSLSGTNADNWEEFCKAVNDDYIDYDSYAVGKFICKFRDEYGTEPKDMAYHGFNIGWYFLNALMNYGDNVSEGIATYRIPLLNTKFYFEKKKIDDGYENTFWNVYQYENYEKVLLQYE